MTDQLRTVVFQRRALVTLCAGLWLGSGLLSACSPDQPSFKGVDITGADYAKGFAMQDHNGQVRSHTALHAERVPLKPDDRATLC
jgi:hypothetical protein